MQEWCYIYPDYMEHHGILGQKWGVRRYQNKDGTLTAAGRKRYRVDEEGNLVEKTRSERRAEAKQAKKEKAEEQKRLRLERENETNEKKKERLIKSRNIEEIYKNRELFTYQELNEIYNRYNLERNLSNLVPKEKENSYADIVKKVSDGVNSTANLVESGTRAYNAFAKISNSVGGADLPVVGQEKKEEPSARDKATKKLQKENEYLRAVATNKQLKKMIADSNAPKVEKKEDK